VSSLWKADPYSGTLFVFFGRRMDRVKVLFFSAGGFVLFYNQPSSHYTSSDFI
jgi:transposase